MIHILSDEWKRVRKPAGIYLGFLLIFVVVFYLYGVPWEPLIYAGLICAILLLLYSVLDLFIYFRKYERLQKLRSELQGNLKEMPTASSGIEKEYQQMLQDLYEKKQKIEYQMSKGYEELADYYTTWAHQIKTPISAMRLLLQTGKVPDLSKMEVELFKIEQYVEMALGYLRSEELSRDMRIEEFDLDRVIRQGVKKYAKLFILNKISLNYEGVDCKVVSDEKWLLFVLEQILSNALKYTRPHGQISIYMEKGKEKTLVIEDTGIGISAQDLPRVWERGFTGYNGRLDKRATGIGLYSVRKVMNYLSHEIYITSQVGKGTQVHLVLSRQELDFME